MDERALIAVLVGTDHHPFDRLVGWVSELALAEEWEWFVQHGSTTLPSNLSGVRMLDVDELQKLLGRASAVVTHGGPGLIMEARASGHRPVVVPRDPRLGEHVDAHQQHFAHRLARSDLIDLANDPEALRDAITRQVERGRQPATHRASAHEASSRLGAMVDAMLAARGATPVRHGLSRVGGRSAGEVASGVRSSERRRPRRRG